jgi:hypothetical protein
MDPAPRSSGGGGSFFSGGSGGGGGGDATTAAFERRLEAAGFSRVVADPPQTSRVMQLDALDMESEIGEELLQAVARIARPVAPALLQRFRPELTLALHALLFRYTVYANKPSLGCQLQGLVFANGAAGAAADAAAEAALATARAAVDMAAAVAAPASSDASSSSAAVAAAEELGIGTLTHRQKVLYFVLGICGPWVRRAAAGRPRAD